MRTNNGITKTQVALLILGSVISSGVGSAITGLVTVGNDHFTTIANAKELSELRAEIKKDYVRSDVYRSDQTAILDKLDSIYKLFERHISQAR